MSIPVPQALLDAITRHVEKRLARRLRPSRFATIDPAYVAASFPGTLPKVTFDGEGALTLKTYNVAGTYSPQPGHRVLLVPAGNTYVIVGKLAQ